MKGTVQKITTKEIKQAESLIYLLIFMLFQMALYMLEQITASEILKRVLISFNVMVGVGVFLGLFIYLVIKKQK
ncbi:MAG: hypothetical protein ABWJ99_00820 [Caldimicrobium sp.]